MSRKLNIKAMIAFAVMAFFIGILFVIPSAADNVGNYEPDGGSVELYAGGVDEYNRTIYVTCQDQDGRILKKVTCHAAYENNPFTPSGGLKSFVIGIYGYDITDFESDAGLLQTCKLCSTSGTPLCYDAIIQFDYKFYTSLSGKTINISVTLRKSENITVTVCHYLQDSRGNLTPIDATEQSIEYYQYVDWQADVPSGYILAPNYQYQISGVFSYSWMNSCENLSERISYDLMRTSNNQERSEYHESKHGTRTYCTNRELKVSFVYVLQSYAVDYDANGGTDAPDRQIKLFDIDLTLTEKKPIRDGFIFVGWNTARDKTVPNYLPGGVYKQNRSVTMYAIWRSTGDHGEIDEYYKITYDANGGENPPPPQYKYRGELLILSGDKPTRDEYIFKGWSPDRTAKIPTYSVEDIYEKDESCTLYAIWKEDYDYALSDLTIFPTVTPRSTPVTVSCIITSDTPRRHKDIPVSVYVDGRLVMTETVDCRADGVGELSVVLDSGSVLGDHTVKVVIDEAFLADERDRRNSVDTGTFTVTDDTDISFEVGGGGGSGGTYYAGETVVTSFKVRNSGRNDMIPASGLSATFRAYYVDDVGDSVVMTTQTWPSLVIPKDDTNLIYFKWTIPASLACKDVWIMCTLEVSGFDEIYTGNNTVSYSIPVYAFPQYHTPDTRFESAPADYRQTSALSSMTQQIKWNEWKYENGRFVKHTYGVQISASTPVVTPDSACTTAFKKAGKWTMKSGYGITLSYTAGVTRVNGCEQAPAASYTPVQYATALYPEYNYAFAAGKCDTLDKSGTVFRFKANPDAHDSARVHFIPVYVADGKYTVCVRAEGVWTPVGVIYARWQANAVTIEGTLYDDWYHG